MKEEGLLLAQLRGGSEKAFGTLYERHRGRIYATVRRLVKSHELADEVLQDVFVKVWQNRAAIDLSKDFSAYLNTIARNTVYDCFRRIASDRAKIEHLILTAVSHEPAAVESLIARKEVHLDDILARMPEKCREVYVLCKIEGRSHEEVSKMLIQALFGRGAFLQGLVLFREGATVWLRLQRKPRLPGMRSDQRNNDEP